MQINKRALGIMELSRTIYPLLAARGPDVQGGVIADLLAMWLAGHPAETRETLLDLTIETARALIPVNEAIIAAQCGGRPEQPETIKS